MKAKRFCCTIAVIICGMLCGCRGPAHELSEGTYCLYPDSVGLSPTIRFDLTDHTFTFIMNPAVSYLPNGTFQVLGGTVTATTVEGAAYRFEIKDEDTIAFLQEGSSEAATLDRMTPVVDGTEFHLVNEG